MSTARKLPGQQTNAPNLAAPLIETSALDPDALKAAEPDATEETPKPAPVEAPVLSYNPKKLRVQVKFTAKSALETLAPPPDIIVRARARMLAEKTAGKVDAYVVYENHFEEAWMRLRALAQTGRDVPESITMTIAAGAPKLAGLELSPATNTDHLAVLTIKAPAKAIEHWQLEWLRLQVKKALRLMEIRKKVNLAQLHAALIRAKAGHPIQGLQLKESRRPSRHSGKSYELVSCQARREVSLRLYDLTLIADIAHITERMQTLEESIGKLNGSPRGRYQLLKEDLLETFTAALNGPQRLGLEMPMTILAALDPSAVEIVPQPKVATPAAAQTAAPSKSESHASVALAPAAKPLYVKFNISPDRMSATVAEVDSKVAQNPTMLERAEDWLLEDVKRAGIVHGIATDLVAEFLRRLRSPEGAAGLAVAAGTSGVAGSGPELEIVAGAARTDDDGMTDMRTYRKKPLVKAGDLIAEIRYAEPPTPGKDVTGHDVAPPAGAALPEVKLGEGVQMREPGRFYATKNGIVQNDENGLTLLQMLVHEGNVSLATGDIVFDGPVEIKGDIDSGAKVKTTGDLIIHGEVRGGLIESKGNIEVARGIVLGPGGLVKAKGNIKADFIENATIICGGSLTVTRSVMQSKIMVAGAITINGQAGGGSFFCGDVMKAGNLGMPDGARTAVTVGLDFRSELSINAKRQRHDHLQKKMQEDRLTFKEIMKKRPEQLSATQKQTKDKLRERLTRWGAILEKAQKRLDEAMAKQTANDSAKIYVSGKLAANCQIRIAGKAIPLAKEAVSVVITSTETNGSHLTPHTGGSKGDTGKKVNP